MASIMASVGEQGVGRDSNSASKTYIYESIGRLSNWLEKNNYRGYDTFDGLSAILRPFTLETKILRIVLQQSVRRFPINLRPMLGIRMEHSSKGMGFLARGFMRLHRSTGDPVWAGNAEMALQWLIDNQSKGYSGACWGNHFDYQSRGSFYVPKGVPTIVWTSLIGHAFLDGYEHFGKDEYLQTAVSACEHILRDYRTYPQEEGLCITYVPGLNSQVHNASTLGASLLARAYSHTHNQAYRELAQKALLYTAHYQRPDGSWYYAEHPSSHWVDNFHTGYVLDCFKRYVESTGDDRFKAAMDRGYKYWRNTFFLLDGTPRYYNHKTLPIDIQCSSQAIDTLVYFSDRDPESLSLALKVAQWTIEHMQDPTGYFYYRRYSRWVVNKTPTLHWGQATMLCALAGLYESI